MAKQIFCFASNEAGIHGAGAALEAYKNHGARYGKSYGHYGDSFAIPTKDCELVPLKSNVIEMYIHGFLAYAHGHRKLTFKVTRIGCGLAGFYDGEIAPMFIHSPINCQFDEAWKPFLEGYHTYWGTYP